MKFKRRRTRLRHSKGLQSDTVCELTARSFDASFGTWQPERMVWRATILARGPPP